MGIPKNRWLQKFLLYAYTICKKHLPDRLDKFSKKTFTAPQIIACLLIKEFMKCSFRDIEEMLRKCPEARKSIDLKEIPDHSTFSRYFKRISAETRKLIVQEMAELVLRIHSGKPR
jgi:hypothetical protein